MNPDLYTEEFRNFKYLKSTPEQVNFYKEKFKYINTVQPWASTNDPTFVWPHRVEFIEQLLDLNDDIVFLVETGVLRGPDYGNQMYTYEDARLVTINKPVIYYGNPMASSPRMATLDDVANIEKSRGEHYYLCPNTVTCPPEQIYRLIYRLSHILLLPIDSMAYNAVFYDREVAEKYRCAVTECTRKSNDAVSAITRLF